MKNTPERAAVIIEIAQRTLDEALNVLRTPDWINELTYGPAAAPNPHYHCNSQDPRPCPTGEHTNPAPVTYAIPNPPPVERSVSDNLDLRWAHEPDGDWTEPTTGDRLSWIGLLLRGPLTLLPLTEEERESERLYGPLGARWGQPGEECPYWRCVLDRGHIAPHIDQAGASIVSAGPMEPYDAFSPSGVTPQQAAETPCTCGHPAAHLRFCPRYERIDGDPQGCTNCGRPHDSSQRCVPVVYDGDGDPRED